MRGSRIQSDYLSQQPELVKQAIDAVDPTPEQKNLINGYDSGLKKYMKDTLSAEYSHLMSKSAFDKATEWIAAL